MDLLPMVTINSCQNFKELSWHVNIRMKEEYPL